MSGPIAIAAGGTAGHFFPAEALGSALASRGHDLMLMTDRRTGKRTHGIFADKPQYVLDGSGIAGLRGVRKLQGAAGILRAALAARRILAGLDVAAIIGFGGYPSVAPLIAARLQARARRPKIVIHEGNAVLGQANAVLARMADKIATSLPLSARLHAGSGRVCLTGMPVRPEISARAGSPYSPPDEAFRLLIWGGSLGARVFADIVPEALAALPAATRERLLVTQQVRREDAERVAAAYRDAGIRAEIAPFLDRIAERLADAHLVIGRAGGSSVAELTAIGRPSILVPLPIAASDEQTANARSLVAGGAAWMVKQPQFTPASLHGLLCELLDEPSRLIQAAAAAASLGQSDAASRLADLIEALLQPSNDRIGTAEPPADRFAHQLEHHA